MNYILSALLSGVLLWLCLATRVEAPRPQPFKPTVHPAALLIDCNERKWICKRREVMAKIKERK